MRKSQLDCEDYNPIRDESRSKWPAVSTFVQFMWERQRTRIKVTLGITGL